MSDQAGFDLELRLDGLPSDDALRIEASADLTAMSVGDMLVELFGTEESPAFTASELRNNPDLPDIHAQFVDLFDGWRAGASTLRFYARDSTEIDPDELVSEVLAGDVLSIAVRQDLRGPGLVRVARRRSGGAPGLAPQVLPSVCGRQA